MGKALKKEETWTSRESPAERKDRLRAEIQKQTEEFLAKGGSVKQIDSRQMQKMRAEKSTRDNVPRWVDQDQSKAFSSFKVRKSVDTSS